MSNNDDRNYASLLYDAGAVLDDAAEAALEAFELLDAAETKAKQEGKVLTKRMKKAVDDVDASLEGLLDRLQELSNGLIRAVQSKYKSY
jgi:chaperonin cofactor prefoldin